MIASSLSLASVLGTRITHPLSSRKWCRDADLLPGLCLQKDRDVAVLHEKEFFHKLDIAEGARRVSAIAESRMGELEGQLQQCMAERDNLQLRLEEKLHAQGLKQLLHE